MRKLITLLALLLAFSFSLVAQEAEQDNITENPEVEVPAEQPQPENDDEFVYKLNQPGDWFVKVGVNGGFPVQPATMNFGLDLNLGFYYFLAPFFAVGGDIAFDYNPTVGEKVFYCIPFMAKALVQYTIGKFEIPFILGFGGAIERHNSNSYFGMIIKPEIGLFYRFNADWSIGGTFGTSILPQ